MITERQAQMLREKYPEQVDQLLVDLSSFCNLFYIDYGEWKTKDVSHITMTLRTNDVLSKFRDLQCGLLRIISENE